MAGAAEKWMGNNPRTGNINIFAPIHHKFITQAAGRRNWRRCSCGLYKALGLHMLFASFCAFLWGHYQGSASWKVSQFLLHPE